MTGRRLAVVSEGCLFVSEEAEGPPAPILVGSQTWYRWLSAEHQRSFSFRNALGTFTVRREYTRQGNSWYAYRKREGKLRKAYLGKTEELTLSRLNAAAARLAGQHRAADDPASCTPEPEGRASQAAPAGPARGREQPLLPETSASVEAAATEQVSPAALPVPPTPLIGRQHEVEALCSLLSRTEVRLLTLTGTGGIGKTRLALAVAATLRQSFADGSWCVPLAPLSDPALMVPTIVHTLGLPEVGGRSPLEQLKMALQSRELLLLLDNFEHVLSAAPALADLLGACPHLTLLVTSRAVLRVSAEQVYVVPPLTLPDGKQPIAQETLAQSEAVALFLARARAVKPDFELTASNAGVLAEICTRLDGLPLAIELAAARLKLLSPDALLGRLEQRLAVLTQGPRDVPERQQTLRQTLQWSYDVLSAAEQRLFRRLAVFAGGCTLEAVEAVCTLLNDAEENVLERVSSLLDHSLLQQAQPEGEEPRLLMLETLREYGLECLETSGEVEATHRAHAAYYLRLAEAAEPQVFGVEQVRWLERLEQEHENLRAALRWCLEGAEREMALRLAGALWPLWWWHGYLREGRSLLERALTTPEPMSASMRAKALTGAGQLTYLLVDQGQAEAYLEESLVLLRELEDPHGMVMPLLVRGFLAWQLKSDFAAARRLGEEALAISRQVAFLWGITASLRLLALVACLEGQAMEARALGEECLVVARQVGSSRSIADALYVLGQVIAAEGDLVRGHSLLAESLACYKEAGDERSMAQALAVLGQVAASQGEYAQGQALLQESLDYAGNVGDAPGLIVGHLSQAMAAFGQGDYPLARALFEEGLRISSQRDYNPKLYTIYCLKGLGTVLSAQGEPAGAARLWGAAERLRANMAQFPVLPLFRIISEHYEHSVSSARARLGPEAFAAAWAQGRTMTPEQALASPEPAMFPGPLAAPSSPSAVSTPAPKASTSADRLTAREMDVLRLLAQGLTSAQIAERLVISVVTVNFHVRSIYSKLGVSSRSAATRYVIEHHLV